MARRISPPHKPRRVQSKGFPVVGVGASAGGLEAFKQLISKIPAKTNLAFVLIQHLEPTHPSMSAEIISRITRLKVKEAKEGVRVRPGHVYLIPPNCSMRIQNGVLNLHPRIDATRHHLTVDFFFQSLAQAEGSRAIGVVLSGLGTDGTQGLRDIKAEGGLTFAQEPTSAKFEGMPQSAIAAGLVDFILPPEAIARELVRVAAHPYVKSTLPLQLTFEKSEIAKNKQPKNQRPTFSKIFDLLRKATGVDFTHYKIPTITRRIERRMLVQKTKSLVTYAKYLETHPTEIRDLYNDILIDVTSFFRDGDSFSALTKKVLPQILTNRAINDPIRIWVPGCSTGEEAYSIAIILTEALESQGTRIPIQIFATDISEPSIQKARLGTYPESIVESVSKDRLKQFFDKVKSGYKVRKSIRDICLFSRHDVSRDPPFSKLDLVSCRNMLIYFEPILQKQVIPIFHYALKPKGFLWLGRSESVSGFSKHFNFVSKPHKIYTKLNIPTSMSFHFPIGKRPAEASEPKPVFNTTLPLASDFRKDADKIVLLKFGPPGVVVDSGMEILQFRGRTFPFLESVTAGEPSNNLFKMIRSELLPALRKTVTSVKTSNVLGKRKDLSFTADGRLIKVDIEVIPINSRAPLKERMYLILFEEAKAPSGSILRPKGSLSKIRAGIHNQQITDVLRELTEAKEDRQSIIEQFEATQEEFTSTNEELQSTNEELQSTNEELQSTNEELQTAKEELQSTNEELITVNDELQARNIDLITLSSDLTNLLASTEIPIVMVGSNNRIRRFTSKAETTFNLIATDVGRPIGDIKSNFGLDLDGLLKEVTKSLQAKEIEVQDGKGAWRRLLIRPYKTVDNKIDGAIIALFDIEDFKQKERKSKEEFDYLSAVTETVPLPLVVLNRSLQYQYGNDAFHRYFQVADELADTKIFDALGMQGRYFPRLKDLILKALVAGQPFSDFEVDAEFPRIGHRILLLSGKKIHWKGDEPLGVLLSFVDVTDQRIAEDDRNLWLMREQQARGEAEKANNAKDIFLATLSHELRTPLTAILAWAQMIRMGIVDLGKAKEGAAVIEQSAKMQSLLIDDLLDISRITSGKMALELVETNPAQIIRAAIESIRPMIKKKDIRAEVVLDPTDATIFVDPTRLQQILWNLLVNAVKFSSHGGRIEVRLETVGTGSKKFAQIQVVDFGKGISKDFLPHLFSQFSQADSAPTRSYGGLGLGLSIVHNLVQMLGGEVSAESAGEGMGATFTVTFPIILPKTAPTLVPAAEPETPGTLGGMRILFVDDDESTRESLSLYLRSVGGNVQTAESVGTALELLPVFKPDILISDIAMPEEDGFFLIKKVRALAPSQGGRVPALALTAYVTPEDVKRSVEAGFQAHMSKPVDAVKLIGLILKVAAGTPKQN